MPPSKALVRFEKTFDRAYRMVDRHFEIFKKFVESETEEAWDETHDDLFRAAIVLTVAAMDCYFTDRFCEGLIPYLKRHQLNKKLVQLLLGAGFDTETALEMFKMQRPNRRLSNLVKRKLDTLTCPHV